ncbi:hypothetical protein [Lacipirellula sp.]|uniref:hypothetical protein n=1 Tax=Lacipirellula sp. TaxID=2691419 RepID=UPI003D10BC44
MKLYRPFLVELGPGEIRLITRIKRQGQQQELWHQFAYELAPYIDCTTNDSGLTAVLLEAMRCNEPIWCEAPISSTLLRNLRYYMHAMRSLYPSLNIVEIQADSLPRNRQASAASERAMGFSCGVDSFCSLLDWHHACRQPEFAVTRLFFADAGSHGSGDAAEYLFQERKTKVEAVAAQLGLPVTTVRSNVHLFGDLPFEHTHVARTISCVMPLQGFITTYLVPSTNRYLDLCPDGSTPLADHLLSSELVEVVHDGAQYSRIEKCQRIASWKLTYDHLNVCTMETPEARNCSACNKCARAMLTFDMLGYREEYRRAFDYSKFKESKRQFVERMRQLGTASPNFYWREIVEFAATHGYRLDE